MSTIQDPGGPSRGNRVSTKAGTLQLVAPTSIRRTALTYHRANPDYRLLLGVCELVVRELLPTQEAGTLKLTLWVSDDAMSSLYERFLREYYSFFHPELSPRASTVSWDHDEASAVGAEQLPAMRTDVTLRHGQRELIIDAKYYRQSMQVGRWDNATVHSAHLYQVLTYAKNADVNRDGSVSGLLLYARTEAPAQPDLMSSSKETVSALGQSTSISRGTASASSSKR